MGGSGRARRRGGAAARAAGPTATGPRAAHGRLQWAARALLAPALVLLAAGCISGPLQTFRSSAERIESNGTRTVGTSSVAEIVAHDTLGPDLEYRVTEQFIYSTMDRRSDGLSSYDETIQNRPTIELTTRSGPLSWSQRLEVHETRSLLDLGDDNRLLRTSLLEKLDWTPDGLPQVTTWVNYRTVEDDFFIEQRTIESLLDVRQSFSRIDYQYTFQAAAEEDLRTNVENDRYEHTLRTTYRDEFLDGRLSTMLSVFGRTRRDTLSGSVPGTPSVLLPLLQGFSAIDSTPQISTLPLSTGLVDGIDTVSAGINIGGFVSGGAVDWNMGVRLPSGSSAEAVHIVTVDEVPSNMVNQFSFSVWVSDDNAFWTQVSAAAAFDYDAVFRRFRLAIPAISGEYLKVVNTASPPAAPAVFVSEMRVFASAVPGTGTSRRSDDSSVSTTAAVSYRFSDDLTVGYDVLVQSSEADTEGLTTRDETRIDNGIWANYRPHTKVDTSFRLSNQSTDDSRTRDEDFTLLTGVVSYRPLDTLDVNTSYTQGLRRIESRTSFVSEAIQTLVSARLLDTLRFDVSGQLSQQDDRENDRLIDHVIVGASLTADLTEKLEMTLGYRDDAAEVSGAGAGDVPDPSERRTEVLWLYRPSEQLTAQLEFDWVESFAGEGLDQRTRIDWIPFARGQLGVQLDYDRVSTESVGRGAQDRYRALLRYSVTPRAFFELQYSALVPDEGERTDVAALAFNFRS